MRTELIFLIMKKNKRKNPASNPFWKFLKKEDHLQIQLAQWLSYQFPDVLWIHIPNEGKRTPFERFLFSLLGTAKGASDMIFFEPRGQYHGLAIELKVTYDNKSKNQPSKDQLLFVKKMNDRGYKALVCWDYDEAEKEIKQYLK